MKIHPLICLILVASACKHKPQPVIANTTTDSIIPAMDTAIIPYSEANRIKDSLQYIHKRDSFLAIPPLAIFTSDEKGDAYYKLFATLIDTTGVTKTPITFSDTTITKFDKDENPVSRRKICKNNRFRVEVLSREDETQEPRRLFINGRELRPGIEIDTSISGSQYKELIDIDAPDCALLQFGTREYLLLGGVIYNCNGIGCNVRYYILFDPIIRKAMLLEQYGSDFIAGYDKKTNTPVFIDMYESWANAFYTGALASGKVYRFDHTGKIKRMLDRSGKQFYFSAYSPSYDDTLIVKAGNFPARQ